MIINYFLVKPITSGVIAGVIDYALISGNQRQSLGFAASTTTSSLIGEMIAKRMIKDPNSSLNTFEARLTEVGVSSIANLALDSMVFNTRFARSQQNPARLAASIASDVGSTYIKDFYSPSLP